MSFLVLQNVGSCSLRFIKSWYGTLDIFLHHHGPAARVKAMLAWPLRRNIRIGAIFDGQLSHGLTEGSCCILKRQSATLQKPHPRQRLMQQRCCCASSLVTFPTHATPGFIQG